MIIGITGGTGCGKTTLLDVIRERGGLTLDCDAIYHTLLRTDGEMLRAIDTRFPGTVKEGVLDRKRLGQQVLSDPGSLKALNAITHGVVRRQVERELANKPALAAIDAIGLFESGLNTLCDLTVAVTAPRETRIRRLMERDGITERYAQMRIDAQRPQEDFIRLCDCHLENSGTREEFRLQCLAFLRKLGIIESKE